MNAPAFRLGSTSYIIPADLLPNARYLAGRVADMELVLFETAEGSSNLPTPEAVAELGAVAAAQGLTYTVHLPLDLRLGEAGHGEHPSLGMARKVIERTRPLKPWAYVLHLDGRDLLAEAQAGRLDDTRRAAWQDQAVRALERAAGWAGGAENLAVENLEHYPLDFIMPVIERMPVSRCVDVGHLWVDGHDPVPYLQAALPRTRVVHLHGLAERDHNSLAHMPAERLDPVLAALVEAGYAGVLTLEVFGEADFEASVRAVEAGLRRLGVSQGAGG